MPNRRRFKLNICPAIENIPSTHAEHQEHYYTVVLAFLSRYRPISVAVPMGRRYLNVTHRSKKRTLS